jgi:hypothetical protein
VKPRRWKRTRGRGTLVVCDDLTIHVCSYGPASWSYWYEILGAQIGGEDDDLPRRKDAEWAAIAEVLSVTGRLHRKLRALEKALRKAP